MEEDVLRELLPIFGRFSLDIGMKTNRLHKVWLLLAPHFISGARWPLALTASASVGQACECSPCQQFYCICAFSIYPWDTVKDSSSPCCNAACQLGSLVYTSSWPLPFPHLFKSSGLAHVSTSVTRCKVACGTDVTGLSHRMGFPLSRWPRTRHRDRGEPVLWRGGNLPGFG